MKTQLLRNNISLLKELSHINPRDVPFYEKDKEVTISFIDELFAKKKLKTHNTTEEKAIMDKIVTRSNMTQITRFKLESIITSVNFQKFEENMKQFDFDHVNIMHTYATVLVQEILDAYELFKKYLLIYIDKNTFQLRGSDPLGTVLKKLQDNGINHKFDECMDVQLRNALAHGSYWFSGTNFYYVKDPNLKHIENITLDDLTNKMRDVEVLVQAFGDNAVPRMMQLMSGG